MIYNELEKRNYHTMSTVIASGSGAAVLIYALVGIFGYVTFVDTPEIISTNILEAPWNNAAVTAVKFLIIIHIKYCRVTSLYCSQFFAQLHCVYFQQKIQ